MHLGLNIFYGVYGELRGKARSVRRFMLNRLSRNWLTNNSRFKWKMWELRILAVEPILPPILLAPRFHHPSPFPSGVKWPERESDYHNTDRNMDTVRLLHKDSAFFWQSLPPGVRIIRYTDDLLYEQRMTKFQPIGLYTGSQTRL
jgi:hypothetical protein